MFTKNNRTFSFQEYIHAYNHHATDEVIDLDKRLKDQFDFQIYRLEEVINTVEGVLPPCRQAPYWLTLVRKGAGETKIGNEFFPIEDYTLFIVPGRTVHSSKYWSTDCSGYLLSFTADFLLNSTISMEFIRNRKALKSNIRPCLKLNKAEITATTRMFEDMFKISKGEKSGGKEMLAIKILELLIYCDPLITNNKIDSNLQTLHPLVGRFTELLNQKYDVERGVQYYADILDVHPNYLNFLLKKHTGISAKESIDHKLVLESKYLLINRSLRIKEIAYKLGFDDPNNFSTFFQKYAGSSPVTYRTSLV